MWRSNCCSGKGNGDGQGAHLVKACFLLSEFGFDNLLFDNLCLANGVAFGTDDHLVHLFDFILLLFEQALCVFQ